LTLGFGKTMVDMAVADLAAPDAGAADYDDAQDQAQRLQGRRRN
jgi:hypothetical protein